MLTCDAAKADRAELAERVDKVWAARLVGPDPLLAGCQREEVRVEPDLKVHVHQGQQTTPSQLQPIAVQQLAS